MAFIKKHWLIIVIVAFASWLRVWQLNSLGIFFGDAGHDILSAISAVENKELPLLGIESSVPRFKQGPTTVWLHSIIHLFAGRDLYWHWLFFAMIGIAAVIATYEFCQLYLSNKISLLASLLIASSPLAVAHSRMAYHITPIPFMTVLFLAATVRLAQNKKNSVFWAFLAWAALFQFELAVTPLALVIIYILYRQKKLTNKTTIIQTISSLLLGLSPQILYDLTHRFTHLGGFLIWVGYRILSLAPTGNHSFSLATLVRVGDQFSLYAGRIFSFDQPSITLLSAAVIALTLYLISKQMQKKTAPVGIEVVALSTLILTSGYILHGNPSEAYFPPFIVLLPLLVGYGVSNLPPLMSKVGVCAVIALTVLNITQISQNQFFMNTKHTFSYGYGIGEQRLLLQFIKENIQQPYYFATTHAAGVFPNYFDNLRLISWEQQSSENPELGQPIFIEDKNSPLSNYPNAVKVAFPTVDLYYLL